MGDDRFKPIDIFQLYSKLKMFEVKKEDVIVQEGKAGGYIYLIDGIILIEKTYTVKNMLNNIEHQGKVTLELGSKNLFYFVQSHIIIIYLFIYAFQRKIREIKNK